jgi:hypothetical protein
MEESPYETEAMPPRLQAWMTSLRAACIAVVDNPPSLIAAMTVSRRFEGASEGEWQQLNDAAQRLAEEYGLRIEIDADFPRLAARLSRSNGSEEPRYTEGLSCEVIAKNKPESTLRAQGVKQW